MDLQISGKTALIMGAGGGLGSVIARTLSAEGANVVLADINLEAAQSALGIVESAGQRFSTCMGSKPTGPD